MTCPPSLVHAIPEHLRRCVKTTLQADSVIPLTMGKCWRL